MKLGVTFSGIAHATILAWGLLTISAPEALKVQDVEALPVDIVPFEELTKQVKGAKEAKVVDKPAPKKTEKKKPTPDAQEIGDKKIDAKAVENAKKESPKPVEKAESKPKAEKAKPTPKPKPVEEQKKEKPKEKVEATEVAALPKPKEPITPEKPAEVPEKAPEAEKVTKVPDDVPKNVPVPEKRPKPPKPAKPTTAKSDERKKVDEIIKASEGNPDSKKKKTKDAVKNKVNKEESAGGGAKASTKTAALGTKKGAAGSLSQNELDALISRVTECSTGSAGRIISDNLRITVTMNLNKDGSIAKVPKIDVSGGQADEQKRYGREILRFVKRCAPYDFLPREKYETWAETVVNFYPAQMFQ